MNLNYGDILTLWLKTKSNIKIQSYQKYERLIQNHIAVELGDIKANKLAKENIICFFDKQKNNNIAISTQKTMLYIIKSSLEYGYNNNYNSFLNLNEIKFKKELKTIYVLSKEEQIKIESILKTNMNIHKACLLLCLYTGLRVGEVCGIKWEDINFRTNSLEIKRTIERIKNKNPNINSKTILIESTPKSETSSRIIPIPSFLINILQEFESNKKYFLLSNSEKLYDPRLFESFYARLLKKYDLNYNKFHTLRHTFATRSIESKMDIKTLSEILGHSSIEMTLKLYVHPTYEFKKNSIENLVQFMANN